LILHIKAIKISAGYFLFELPDNDLIVVGLFDIPTQNTSNKSPSLILNRFDRCGNKKFEKVIDTTIQHHFNPIGNKSNFDVILDTLNGIFYCIANTKYYNQPVFIKFNISGQILGKNYIGDPLDSYLISKISKINSNKFLLVGSSLSFKNNISTACALMTDDLGNIIFKKSYYYNTTTLDSNCYSRLTNSYQLKENEILLLGMRDSLLLIYNIDTLGNILDSHFTFTQTGIFNENLKHL
jgi:hypothetical protein